MADSVLAAIAAISSLAIRSAVGRWGYSGKGDYPMFGDFEAQRHWMEITAYLPIGDWYRNSADNDLLYWGLDYPPLTAYVSWAFGMIAKYIYPDLVKLKISRAFEEAAGKTFMRSSVLLVDIMILLPSITYSLDLLIRHRGASETPRISIVDDGRQQYKMSSFLLLLLCQTGPANLLVDHGHFQYNGVCIGLALLGAVFILKDRDVFGSILFCLSLNFKQMALYYAPVFFFVLLRKCFEKSTWKQRFFHLFRIGSSVLLTFAALWWPFCVYAHQSETCGSSLLQVLSRQFPFSRGIFEDKVANIWYSTSIIFDFRQHFSISQMASMSLCLTLLLLCPIAAELMSRKITPFKFFLSLINCSMAFFLASFQVHEKSLLLPLVPALLLIHYKPHIGSWFQVLGAFTMFPLLIRDGLRLPYFAVCAIFICIYSLYIESKRIEDELERNGNSIKELKMSKVDNGTFPVRYVTLNRVAALFIFLSYAGMIVLHCMEAKVVPPERYPDLYPALFSLFGAANLIVIYVVGVFWQWSGPYSDGNT